MGSKSSVVEISTATIEKLTVVLGLARQNIGRCVDTIISKVGELKEMEEDASGDYAEILREAIKEIEKGTSKTRIDTEFVFKTMDERLGMAYANKGYISTAAASKEDLTKKAAQMKLAK